MKQVTNFEEFELETNQKGWGVVYFTASWCRPCSTFSPTMDKVSNAFSSVLHSVKVDIEGVPEAAGALHIRSVPSVLLFKDGRPVEGVVGVQSYEQVSQWLMNHVLAY